jgi:hypothetical protein
MSIEYINPSLRTKQIALSSEKFSLKEKPSCVQKFLDLVRSFTGRLTIIEDTFIEK